MMPSGAPMWAELHAVTRSWLCLAAVPVAAAAAVLLMPVNRAIGLSFYGGDAFTDAEYADMLAGAAPQMYTSGLAVGHAVAMLVGALVLARDREWHWAKLPVAALVGLVLGLVQEGVSVPLAAARLRADPIAVVHHLADPARLDVTSTWRVIAVSTAAYPLWTIVGLGFGLLLAHRAALVNAAPALLLTMIWYGVVGSSGSLLLLTWPLAVVFLAASGSGPFISALLLAVLSTFAALVNILGAGVAERRRRKTVAIDENQRPR
jgi:hypothetical protein